MGRIGNELAMIMKPRLRITTSGGGVRDRAFDVPGERPRVETLKIGAEPLVPPRVIGRVRVAMRPLRRPKRMTTR